MATIDHVVCSVDLSQASAHALRHANAWARWYQATLHVLHVAPPPSVVISGSGLSTVLPTRPLDAIRADVERFVTTALAGASLPVLEVVQGHAVDTILEQSARRPRSLLVMGTHGLTGLDRALLGSVTERVAHGAVCPLLVVPPWDAEEPAPGVELSRVVCAVDFRPSSLAGLRYALSLAQENKARLDLVTVLEPTFGTQLPASGAALLEALRERVPDDARQRHGIHEEVLRGSPADALLTYAVSVGAELIVTGTGDRRHLHDLWLGSTTGRLIRSAHCPVLIVPGPVRPKFEHTRSLPKREWRAELERLSLEHQGEPATIAIVREDLGTQREVSGLPLIGMTADLRDGAEEIAIMLARSDGARLTHVIADPQDVRVGETSDQLDLEMFIVGRDGSTTLLGIGGHHV